MKITSHIPPIQPFQTQATGAGPSSTPHDTSEASRLGTPKGLHPSNPSVDVAHEVLAKFRDPSALTAHADHRRDSLSDLKNQIAKQFGADIANAIFSQPNTQTAPSSFHENTTHSFGRDF